MVLWEMAVGTAYFLGLKRTYSLALKLQRRLVSPKHPKTRQFLHRRTRAVFDAALSVHRNIQQRDIEVGRNLGNWILRWLDRMKPSAHIRGDLPATNSYTTKHAISGQSPGIQRSSTKTTDRESDGRLFASPMNIRLRSSPTLSMIMRPAKPAACANSFYRHVHSYAPQVPNLNNIRSKSVFREDIVQWMAQR